jgi:iron complex outermembrane receptor protein
VSVAAVALATLTSTTAWAADESAKSTVVEEVVVTGSLIAGTPKTTAIPIAVIGQEELEKRGSPSVLDVIKSLPIIGPVLGDSNQFSTASQGRNGGGTFNIRGLGAERTLVLLNGRRAGPAGVSGRVGPFDLNVIPSSLIERVEILKDGASSIYGSDAVAGVVNLITKTNLDGFEVNVYGNQSFDGGL